MNYQTQKGEKVAMVAQEVYNTVGDLLIAMENELHRENLSLPFNDAWQEVEYLLTELDAEIA